MRKIIYTLLIISLIVPQAIITSEASIISDRSYRIEQRKIEKENIKQIKELLNKHNYYANSHDIKNLSLFYSDKYVNNDGFNKEIYFKSIETTWEACKDITYTTKILSIDIDGDYASVQVEETANGTLIETIESIPIIGEIHSVATGIYHLEKVNDKWYIASETALTDESSLLYGDARFMSIELQAPAQVSSGETYTSTLKVDADSDTFIIGAIDHDLVTYPTKTPKSELRALPQSQILERLLTANKHNLNEYTIASLAISKVRNTGKDNFQIYMAGLACVMKRINVIPKNNFIKLED